ncbi:unnamed protein product [Arctia plantaginis]|uniref:Uncharacterized protein n=1 Tax=Arctia plantaginis TaxID=874455 RepID=A0A8S1A8M4_ARCPL|nr:unnamed protein product [Arctia plantaginis]
MDVFLCLGFFILLGNAVIAHKIVLDYTNCISKNHAIFINGIENSVKSSDPLEVDIIHLDLPGFEYILKNAKLTGLKDCAVTKLRINKEELTFEYNLECKKIEANGQYKLKGRFGDTYVEGEGNVTVTTGLYIIKFRGNSEKIVHDDKMVYSHIKNFQLDFDAKENLKFNFTNLYGGDKKKSDAFHKLINENWRFTDKELRSAVLTKFMDVFIDHLNDYLKVWPIAKVFPTKCVQK